MRVDVRVVVRGDKAMYRRKHKERFNVKGGQTDRYVKSLREGLTTAGTTWYNSFYITILSQRWRGDLIFFFIYPVSFAQNFSLVLTHNSAAR